LRSGGFAVSGARLFAVAAVKNLDAVLDADGREEGDEADDERGSDRAEPFPAQWLVDMPPVVWGLVRDTVLRCT